MKLKELKEEIANSVKKQSVEMAVVMAETILKRNVTKEDNQALIDEFINTIKNEEKENKAK